MKQLLILSGKGGTGKTTAASAFIEFSNAKAFADCDVDAPNLHLVTKLDDKPSKSDYMGSQKAVIDESKCIGCGGCEDHCRFGAVSHADDKYTINEYACEGCGVCELNCPCEAISMKDDIAGDLVIYKGEKVFSTAKLKMGRGTSGKLVAKVKKQLTDNCDKDASVAIIDGSPGIGCPVIASISGVDLVLVVTEPSLSGISDMERIIKTAGIFRTKVCVCVNKFDVCSDNANKIEKFCKDNEIDFVGRVPYDKTVSKSINEGRSIAEIDCPASKALHDIYNKVIDVLDI